MKEEKSKINGFILAGGLIIITLLYCSGCSRKESIADNDFNLMVFFHEFFAQHLPDGDGRELYSSLKNHFREKQASDVQVWYETLVDNKGDNVDFLLEFFHEDHNGAMTLVLSANGQGGSLYSYLNLFFYFSGENGVLEEVGVSPFTIVIGGDGEW